MEPEPWGAGRSKRRRGQGELLGALLEEECSGGGACWSPVCLRWKCSGPQMGGSAHLSCPRGEQQSGWSQHHPTSCCPAKGLSQPGAGFSVGWGRRDGETHPVTLDGGHTCWDLSFPCTDHTAAARSAIGLVGMRWGCGPLRPGNAPRTLYREARNSRAGGTAKQSARRAKSEGL